VRIDGPALSLHGSNLGRRSFVQFRSHKVALVAGIEKAFLMVSISPKDRDALCFLWVDNINEKAQTFRFTYVVLGVLSRPFLLNVTVKHHLERYNNIHPEFVQKFLC